MGRVADGPTLCLDHVCIDAAVKKKPLTTPPFFADERVGPKRPTAAANSTHSFEAILFL